MRKWRIYLTISPLETQLYTDIQADAMFHDDVTNTLTFTQETDSLVQTVAIYKEWAYVVEFKNKEISDGCTEGE